MIGQRHVMKPSFASGGTALVLLLLNVGFAPTTVYGQEKEPPTESQKQAQAEAAANGPVVINAARVVRCLAN